jgi:photosystem II stability/assembly factor-like uncharacterized protein
VVIWLFILKVKKTEYWAGEPIGMSGNYSPGIFKTTNGGTSWSDLTEEIAGHQLTRCGNTLEILSENIRNCEKLFSK